MPSKYHGDNKNNLNEKTFDPYKEGRWASLGYGNFYKKYVLPHIHRRNNPPVDINFNVKVMATSEYLVEITHKKVRIGLFMAEWTLWEENLCEWLNMLVDEEGYGSVDFDTEGISAVLCAMPHTHEMNKKGTTKTDYLNFLVWADGSWDYDTKHSYISDHKQRIIHIKIERRKLVQLFYDILQLLLAMKAELCPKYLGSADILTLQKLRLF